MSARTSALIAAIYGFIGVACGAMGAHALKARLSLEGLESWRTAVLYLLLHALALLILSIWQRLQPELRLLARASQLMAIGVALFSLSIFALVLGGPSWLGPVTPIGGTLMLVAWVCLAVAAVRSPR